jgi:hypothetical protein
MKPRMFLLIGFTFAAMTWGQAAAEYAVGAGAASGAAAGAKGAGQSVGGVFGNLSKTVDQAHKSDGTAAPASPAASATPAAAVRALPLPTKPIDPSQVKLGMGRDEVLTRFGEPATHTSQIRRSQMLDTFWYKTESNDELIVNLVDGKVASTVLASQRPRNSAAVRR